jgi:hypothetical protein
MKLFSYISEPVRPRLLSLGVAMLAVLGFATLPGCMTKQNQMGVQNKWRDMSPPPFEKGKTTQSDVMRELGPPSQLIALHDQSIFYYLREQLRTKSLFLILYNQTRERISYDRAIFFFDKQGTLTQFAFSEESIPRDK